MKQAESFASIVNRAAEVPEDTGQGGASVELPRLFGNFPIPAGEEVVTDEKQPGAISGLPAYNFTAHFKRFIMGQIQIGFTHEGGAEYAEQDDSAAYEALLNDVLEGKAIIRFEEKQTLKDGTFVISVCYFITKKKKKTSTDE